MGTGMFQIGTITADSLGQAYTQYSPAGLFSVTKSGVSNDNSWYLHWNPVPEPTNALAGILLGLGLLPRRRGR